jgi:urease accessory protein
VLSGDRLFASIDLERGCEAQITTTGATRIYRAKENGEGAVQELHATLQEDAILEYLPDSIIPFGRSRYKQSSRFQLHENAALFAWELVAPGRSGERFSFDDLQIQTEIWSAKSPVVVDCWRIQPRARGIEQAIRMGSFGYQATFYICRPGLPQREWLRWEQVMAELIQTIPSTKQTWGVSALAKDGIVFRGLATEGLYLADALIRFWRCMKVELYGREPNLPRKMF